MTDQSNTLEDLYRSRTAGSLKVSQTASKVLPGGVAANCKYLPPYPIYMLGGQGAEMVDVDGNKYIDLLMGPPSLHVHRPHSHARRPGARSV